jgi:hypothetical protein
MTATHKDGGSTTISNYPGASGGILLTPLPNNADWSSGNVTTPSNGYAYLDVAYYVSWM